MPPIASFTSRSRRSPSARRASAWFVAGLALVTLGACSSGDDGADSSSDTTLIDAVTGEPVEAPDDFTLTFDPPAEEADGAASDDGPGIDEPGDADPASDPADEDLDDGDETSHPLEAVVIDTVVADPEAAPVLDEAAALVCANTEFAMDALIEASPDRTERFTAAAEWAAQSAYQPVRAFADRLAADPTGAEANDLVVAVLETCAAAGYEL